MGCSAMSLLHEYARRLFSIVWRFLSVVTRIAILHAVISTKDVTMFTKRLCTRALLPAILFASINAFSQDYPSKPIRIVTAAAGGGSDFVSRQISQTISGPLGQPVVVENRGSGVV